MANDEEMIVLFEDFERQRRQFYHGQSLFTNTYNRKLFPKTFSFNESIVEPFIHLQIANPHFAYGNFFALLFM
jgi:hypothetical protein